MELNGQKIDYLNPLIKIKDNVLKLNDIVSKLKIQKGYRIPELEGKYGVFAEQDIPKYKILGRYIGYECTNKEWEDIFNYTNSDARHGEYLFSFDIDEKMDKNNVDTTRQITIDPLEAGLMDLKLLYLNDIRKEIFNPFP